MTTVTDSLPLPPGSAGLPLIGETLAFGSNGFRFVEERIQRYGSVFRTHLLGEPTVIFAGLQANEAWTDPELIERDRSMPSHVEALFGGKSLPLLDGRTHLARKTQVLAAFDRTAVERYLPAIQRRVASAFERWARQPEVALAGELKALALESICSDVCSIEPGPVLTQLRNDYEICVKGFGGLPLNLPGLPLRRALEAKDRILTTLARAVAEHRGGTFHDGLSRILATAGPGGERLADEAAALELHHVVVAGFIIFAEFIELVLQLVAHPELSDRLAAELRGVPEQLTFSTLARAPLLLATVMEAKRTTRIIPAVFGRARREFEFRGYRIPKGWRVMWGVRASHLDPELYPEPLHFNPERFLPPRNEHQRAPNAYAPQGPGPALGHKCPGIDYSTIAMALFTGTLVRDYRVELPAQDLTLDFSTTPPVPLGGLRARVVARADTARAGGSAGRVEEVA
jgi:cytochrome P450